MAKRNYLTFPNSCVYISSNRRADGTTFRKATMRFPEGSLIVDGRDLGAEGFYIESNADFVRNDSFLLGAKTTSFAPNEKYPNVRVFKDNLIGKGEDGRNRYDFKAETIEIDPAEVERALKSYCKDKTFHLGVEKSHMFKHKNEKTGREFWSLRGPDTPVDGKNLGDAFASIGFGDEKLSANRTPIVVIRALEGETIDMRYNENKIPEGASQWINKIRIADLAAAYQADIERAPQKREEALARKAAERNAEPRGAERRTDRPAPTADAPAAAVREQPAAEPQTAPKPEIFKPTVTRTDAASFLDMAQNTIEARWAERARKASDLDEVFAREDVFEALDTTAAEWGGMTSPDMMQIYTEYSDAVKKILVEKFEPDGQPAYKIDSVRKALDLADAREKPVILNRMTVDDSRQPAQPAAAAPAPARDKSI